MVKKRSGFGGCRSGGNLVRFTILDPPDRPTGPAKGRKGSSAWGFNVANEKREIHEERFPFACAAIHPADVAVVTNHCLRVAFEYATPWAMSPLDIFSVQIGGIKANQVWEYALEFYERLDKLRELYVKSIARTVCCRMDEGQVIRFQVIRDGELPPAGYRMLFSPACLRLGILKAELIRLVEREKPLTRRKRQLMAANSKARERLKS